MTPEDRPSILEHLEPQLQAIRESIRGVHHRVNEAQEAASEDHKRVIDKLGCFDRRIRSLEADRASHLGARQARRRALMAALPVVAAVVGALAGVAATQILGG